MQRRNILCRAALTMLAGWPPVLSAARAAAAPSREMRQAAALRRAVFVDEQGSAHRLDELTGKLILVKLWAAWCPGCLAELPSVKALADELGPDAIDVVMLSHDISWAGDSAYVRRAGVTFRHWRLSPQTPDELVAAAFRIEGDRFGLPQSLILAGPARTLVDANLGETNWVSPEYLRRTKAWLAVAG